MDKKGQLGGSVNQLAAVGIAFATAAIVLALSGTVLTDLGAGYAAGTLARNATDNAGRGINTIVGYLPLIATVASIVVVLGIVLAAFGGFGRR